MDRTPAGQFSITPAGQERLTELLAEPVEPMRPRNGLLLRLFFASHLPDGMARHLVEDARDQARAALAEYCEIEAKVAAESHPDADYWLTTVSSASTTRRPPSTGPRRPSPDSPDAIGAVRRVPLHSGPPAATRAPVR